MNLKTSPSNTEFKNEWRNISILLTNLHGEDGGHLYLFYNGLKSLYANKHIRICSSVLLISLRFAMRYDIGTRPSYNTLYKQNVAGILGHVRQNTLYVSNTPPLEVMCFEMQQ